MKPILVISPRNDRGFVTLAERLVEDGAGTPGGLQSKLRQQYPKAVVRARDLTYETHVVWYVYRDGRWVSLERGSDVGRRERSEGDER